MYKMFVSIKKVFFTGLAFISSLVSTTPLSCVLMNNQAFKVRPEIINLNSNEPVFCPFILEQANVVVVAIILLIHIHKYVFLTL